MRDLPIDLAGKTGTTDDYTDAWFVGFSPRYTVLAWVGYDVKRTLGHGMTGSQAALPIWRDVVRPGSTTAGCARARGSRRRRGCLRDVEYYTGLLPGPRPRPASPAAPSTRPSCRHRAGAGVDAAHRPGVQLPWYQQRPFYIPKEGENMTSRQALAAAEDGEARTTAAPDDAASAPAE